MGQKPSKKNTVTEVDKAILSLKTQKRKLADYQKKVEGVLEREREAVRALVREGKKSRALLALKKIRLQEDALGKADAWVLRVEQQLADVEIASRQKDVVESLKAGSQAVALLQREVRLEDVERLLGDTEDARAYQQEVQAALAGQLSEEDEEAVLRELEELEKEFPAEETQAEVVPNLPAVPTHVPVRPEKAQAEEEEEVPALPAVPTHKPVVRPQEEEAEEQAAGREAPLLAE